MFNLTVKAVNASNGSHEKKVSTFGDVALSILMQSYYHSKLITEPLIRFSKLEKKNLFEALNWRN